MILLYPTETLYALGVNALDEAALARLYELKGRDSSKVASWLVRNMDDVARYAEVSEVAAKIAARWLPGSLTLVLPMYKPKGSPRAGSRELPFSVVAPDGTIGFRISADPMAEKIIASFMDRYDAPLTCTSANVSGSPTLQTPSEILQQFGAKAGMISEIHDGGPRKGLASTVVRVIGDEVTVLREGEISETEIRALVRA